MKSNSACCFDFDDSSVSTVACFFQLCFVCFKFCLSTASSVVVRLATFIVSAFIFYLILFFFTNLPKQIQYWPNKRWAKTSRKKSRRNIMKANNKHNVINVSIHFWNLCVSRFDVVWSRSSFVDYFEWKDSSHFQRLLAQYAETSRCINIVEFVSLLSKKIEMIWRSIDFSAERILEPNTDDLSMASSKFNERSTRS